MLLYLMGALFPRSMDILISSFQLPTYPKLISSVKCNNNLCFIANVHYSLNHDEWKSLAVEGARCNSGVKGLHWGAGVSG